MAAQSIVQIMLRASGGRQVATETGVASKSLGGLRSAAVGANAAALSVGRTLSNDVTRGMRAVTTTAKYAAGGLGIVGVAAVKMGLDFNSSMEQNEVAFKHFLGSTQRAKAYLGELIDLGLHTPFGTAQIVDASKRLLAFGYNAQQAKGTLKDLADAASGLGVGTEGIDQMVLALGQIKSTGVIQGDELRQLQEAGLSVRKYLIEGGVIADRKDFSRLGALQIRSTKAIHAIRVGMRKDFGGLADEQSKTFAGQINNLRDYASMTLGTITQPLFKSLEDDVLPALSKTAEEINSIFGEKGLTNPEKFAKAWKVTKRDLGPFVDSVEQGLKGAHLDQKLGDVIEWAAPKMADAAAHAAPKAASAFINAFREMGPWGKLLTVGLLAKHFGAFSVLGRMAAGTFTGGFRGGIGKLGGGVAGGLLGGRGLTPANPLFVADVTGGGVGGVPGTGGKGGKGTSMGSKLGKVAPLLLTRAGPLAILAAPYLFPDEAGLTPEQERANLERMRQRRAGLPYSATHETAADRRRNKRIRQAALPSLSLTAKQPLVITLNGKTLAQELATIHVKTRERDRHGG